MATRWLVMCVAVTASALAWAGGGNSFGSLNAGVTYDDNITRGANDMFRRGDFAYRVGADGGVNWRLSEDSGLTLQSRLDAKQWQRFERLSSLRGALLGRILVKPFVGYWAPWFAVESEGAVVGHKDSALRDRWEWSGRVLTGVRLTENLSGSLGYQYELGRGAQWGVWDTQSHGLLTGAEYILTPHLKLFLDYRLGVGKFNASAAWDRPGWSFGNYDRRWRDKALEADAGVPVYGYRMDAVSQQLAVGGVWTLGPHWQLDVSGRYFALDGEAGAFYEGLGANVGAAYRF